MDEVSWAEHIDKAWLILKNQGWRGKKQKLRFTNKVARLHEGR